MDFNQATKDRLKELEKQAEQKKKEIQEINIEIKALKKYMSTVGLLKT